MGPTALLPLRRKACWGFFRPKNPTASAGCEPANLGTKSQHATSRPPKPLNIPMYPARPSFNSSQNMDLSLVSLIPEAARSKALVCGRSLAGIVGSNPVGDMDVNVVCCQVEVSATGWSLVQRSPTDCGVSLCVMRHKNNPLHLQEVGTRYRTKKKEELSI